MNKEKLKEIIIEQNKDFHDKNQLILRKEIENVKKFKEIPHIIIISGIRRCGKSTLLKQINEKFYYDNENSYLNFEDEKLLNFKVEEFNELYETFLQLNENQNVFFFDEIQNIDSWEIAIRRLYEKNKKFYITGSNASMLSKELGTKLTGRHININLYPFSFKEYLILKGFDFKKEDLYVTEKKAKIKSLFNDYLLEGGMPEYLLYKRNELIQQVYEDILYKDILVRYNITDERTLRELSKYLLSNVGVEFSYNKLKSMLSLGSMNTVKKYISYLENSYLIFTLEKFDYSLKKQLINPKKIYAIDSSFIRNVSFKFAENIGRLLENLVFVELKRRNKEIYYHKDKYECDFVIKEGLEIVQTIQVSKSLDDENTKIREIRGLLDACKKYKLKEGLILTEDEEFELEEQKVKIQVMPIWKWLLEDEED